MSKSNGDGAALIAAAEKAAQKSIKGKKGKRLAGAVSDYLQHVP